MPSATIRPPFNSAMPVGQGVGLVQVLRGEEDRDPAGDQGPDVVPDLSPAAWVEPSGRLVEKDHLGPADQRHRQVETTAHPARVRRGRAVGGVDQVEAHQQLGDAHGRLAPAQVVEVGHQAEVLRSGHQVVDRGELAGDADRGADRHRVGDEVVPGDRDVAGVRRDEGGSTFTVVVLPDPFGPSSANTLPAGISRSMPSSTRWSP